MHIVATARTQVNESKLNQQDGTQEGPRGSSMVHKRIQYGASGDARGRLLDEAARKTTAIAGEPRHRALFRFARAIVGLGFEYSEEELREALCVWSSASCVPAKGKHEKSLWNELRRGIAAVRDPTGERLRELFEQSRTEPLPLCANRYPEGSDARRLCGLARVLDDNSKGEPWPLSARTLGSLFDISKMTASRLLRRLQADGVVELIRLGQKGSRREPGEVTLRASTWRFGGGWCMSKKKHRVT